MRLPKWSIAALLILGPSTAFAIGAVVCDPTLSPVYPSPTMPGGFQYPGGNGGCTYYLPLPDGGRMPIPPGDAGTPPKPADGGKPPATTPQPTA